MRILVGVDGSSQSRIALDALASRGLREGATVRLVAVAHEHTLFGFDQHAVPADELASKIVHESAEYLLNRAPSITIEAAVLHDSHVAAALVDDAHQWQADIIAVGSTGTSLLESVFLGSCSQSVLSKSNIPVFVARASVPESKGNILIAVDDSDCSMSAVEWLATQWWANGKTICLITVVEEVSEVVGHEHNINKASDALISWQTEVSSLQVGLDYMTEILKGGLPASTVYHGVLQGEPRDMIVRAATKWPAEVLVVGSHGRKGLSKLVLGSVSQAVTAAVQCSVENVRGQQSQYYTELHRLIEQHRETNALATLSDTRPIERERPSQPSTYPLMGGW